MHNDPVAFHLDKHLDRDDKYYLEDDPFAEETTTDPILVATELPQEPSAPG